jgi:hypothetical protein
MNEADPESDRVSSDPKKPLRELIHRWCAREELKPLSLLLPAWVGNFGLTDDWERLRAAVNEAYVACRNAIPPDEQDLLLKARTALDRMLDRRR